MKVLLAAMIVKQVLALHARAGTDEAS